MPAPGDVKIANDEMRAFLRSLTPADRREIADYFKVTERTVQRWAQDPESGAQSRNFIPRKEWSKEPKDLPEKFRERFNTSRLAARGATGQSQNIRRTGAYAERTKSLRNALKLMRAMREGRLDSFRNNTAQSMQLVRLPEGWQVTVTYAIGYNIDGSQLGGSAWNHDWTDDYLEDDDEGNEESDDDLGL